MKYQSFNFILFLQNNWQWKWKILLFITKYIALRSWLIFSLKSKAIAKKEIVSVKIYSSNTSQNHKFLSKVRHILHEKMSFSCLLGLKSNILFGFLPWLFTRSMMGENGIKMGKVLFNTTEVRKRDDPFF